MRRTVADPIDALEVMICDTLQAAQADGIVSEVRAKIQAWRVKFGGDEVYIARRAHLVRQARIAELASKGLTPAEISARLGVTRQTVHNARKSSAIL
jgi:DNA-binding NarL/FixJ family response regulator